MRILHVIGTVDPRSGGPAASLATLNRSGARGNINEVVTLDDPAADFLQDLEFPVTALGPAIGKYGYCSRLVTWLSENGDRFDGVVVHGLWQYCGFAVWKVFGGRKPYLIFTHGMLDPYFKHAFPLKHLKKWLYWVVVEYWVLRGAYRVLFTCKQEEQLAAQSFSLHRWKGHIVSLGTTLPEGDEAARRRVFLDQFPALQNRRYLLFLGRIDPKKGCDLLVAAFVRAAGLDPALDLVIAGPDDRNWRVKLAASIAAAGLADRVHWTGMLQGDEKWGAFSCSEAFILPSHQENFGISVAEALACGIPVLLSTKVNIASEIVTAGAGLVDDDTEEGTFRLISAWIKMTPQERLSMAAAARCIFEDRYDMRNHSQEVANLLRDALQDQLSEVVPSASAAK